MVLPVTVRQSPWSRPASSSIFMSGTDAADGDEFGHEVFAAGLEVGEHGHAFADAREVVDGELHLGGVGDGEQVQHGIGRTAERDDDGDGVLEGLLA